MVIYLKQETEQNGTGGMKEVSKMSGVKEVPCWYAVPQDIYLRQCRSWAAKISRDTTYPHKQLPHYQAWSGVRLGSSFYPQVIRLLMRLTLYLICVAHRWSLYFLQCNHCHLWLFIIMLLLLSQIISDIIIMSFLLPIFIIAGLTTLHFTCYGLTANLPFGK